MSIDTAPTTLRSGLTYPEAARDHLWMHFTRQSTFEPVQAGQQMLAKEAGITGFAALAAERAAQIEAMKGRFEAGAEVNGFASAATAAYLMLDVATILLISLVMAPIMTHPAHPLP